MTATPSASNLAGKYADFASYLQGIKPERKARWDEQKAGRDAAAAVRNETRALRQADYDRRRAEFEIKKAEFLDKIAAQRQQGREARAAGTVAAKPYYDSGHMLRGGYGAELAKSMSNAFAFQAANSPTGTYNPGQIQYF